MDNVGVFYEVELSTGKKFKAVDCRTSIGTDNPDMDNIRFAIVDKTYQEIKDLISGDITSVTVRKYRPTSPPEYISKPELVDETVYDRFGGSGTIPSIETYYDFGYIVRFYRITDALVELNKQFEELIIVSEGLTNVYETANKEV